jgi:hypothetical protein
MTCEHSWRPIPRWSGRYRCTLCQAIGYRDIVVSRLLPGEVTRQKKRSSRIIPYICDYKDCKGSVVTMHNVFKGGRSRGRVQRCSSHNKEFKLD